MESRILVLLLKRAFVAALATAAAAPAVAQNNAVDDEPPVVIDPALERRDIKPPRIDSENFEVGIYGGLMSIEDFGTNSSVGVQRG